LNQEQRGTKDIVLLKDCGSVSHSQCSL